MARITTRYSPPPSGKRIVYRPCAFVLARRVTFVSSDVTSTVASLIGCAFSALTVPVMMSVVAPICAQAGAAIEARMKKTPISRAPNAFEILPVSKVLPGFWGSDDAVLDGRHSLGLRATATTVIRLPTRVCADALLQGCHCERRACQTDQPAAALFAKVANPAWYGRCHLSGTEPFNRPAWSGRPNHTRLESMLTVFLL